MRFLCQKFVHEIMLELHFYYGCPIKTNNALTIRNLSINYTKRQKGSRHLLASLRELKVRKLVVTRETEGRALWRLLSVISFCVLMEDWLRRAEGTA